MRLATASIVKAPPQLVTEWAAYHLNSGIDEMHIFFDDPQDPAFDLLADQPRLVCYRCDDRFWADQVAGTDLALPVTVPDKQFVMLNRILRREDLQIDWLAHIDSDELIWAPGDVRGALERELREGVDHVQMPPLEAVPPNLQMSDPFLDAHVFKEHRPDLYPLVRDQHVTAPFRGGTILRGHRRGKAWVRFGTITSMRIHGPTPYSLAAGGFVSERASDLRVLHFDAGTFGQWQQKWANRDVYGDHVSRPREQQARRYLGASTLPDMKQRRRALRRLYRDEFLLTDRDEQILRDVGLVRTVDLDPALFMLPPAAG